MEAAYIFFIIVMLHLVAGVVFLAYKMSNKKEKKEEDE